MPTFHDLLFGIFPYIAGAVFLLGSLARFDYAPYTWRSGSSQMLDRGGMVVGSNLFHVGILLLFFGHLVGLLTPHEVYAAFVTAETKQTLAMTAGGIFGTLCFIGMTILVARRLTNDRVRAAGSSMDTAILLILYVQLILGLATIVVSAGHADAGAMLALAHWAQHIVTFQSGAAGFIADAHPLFKAHLLLGMIIVLLFPFSRLVHVWSAPVWYLTRSYQLVRRRS